MKKESYVSLLLSVCVFSLTFFNSCTVESMNKEEINQKEINITNISKSWVVAHFQFTDKCSKTNKLRYQLSCIYLDLNNERYIALDKYSLIEDQGSWKIDDDILELISDKGSIYLKIKINQLFENKMEAEVLENHDLLGVELVTNR